MVLALSTPSWKRDLLTVALSVLAFLARGELIASLIFFPFALVAFEIGRASAARVRDRLALAGRSLIKGHLFLVIGYALVGLTALVLYVQHRLASIIGIYSVYESAGHPVWGRLPRSLVEHLATFSLGVGVVPCVIALAWIGANVVRPPKDRNVHAFACVGLMMTAAIFLHVTNFDLVVNYYVHDRYLMYLVPVVLIGAVLGVSDARPLRWSLVVPLALVVSGFVFGEIPAFTWQRFDWLDLDSPIATVYRVLAAHLGGLTAARGALVALAVGGTALVVVGGRALQPRHLAIVVMGFCTVAMSVVTEWVFVRTFQSQDRNGRSITATYHGTLDWIDEAVGPNSSVTAVQYPISSNWFVSQARWTDFEFFNKSLVRHARLPNVDPFDYLGLWFPKFDLHINPRTGAVAESPTRWVVHSEKETRFQVGGPAKLYAQVGCSGMPGQTGGSRGSRTVSTTTAGRNRESRCGCASTRPPGSRDHWCARSRSSCGRPTTCRGVRSR